MHIGYGGDVFALALCYWFAVTFKKESEEKGVQR